MSGLPSWSGRAAALALFFGVLLALYGALVEPLLSGRAETLRALEEAEAFLLRYQDIARSRPALERQIVELAAREQSKSAYLRGATDALAAAELQERVNAAITASGGTLSSTQPLPATDEGGFRRVAVRIQFSGPVGTVHAVLHTLESAKPFLLVDNLDLRSRAIRRPGGAEEVDPNLMVRLDLLGYLRPDRN